MERLKREKHEKTVLFIKKKDKEIKYWFSADVLWSSTLLKSFCFDASEQKIHIEESLEWFILDLHAQRPKPEECKHIVPPPTAITCDECVRIKQEICRLFGLSMISSMQISGIPFHHDLMLSCQGLFSLLFPLSLQQQPQIFLSHSPLNYSLYKEVFQSSFNIFSQGIVQREALKAEINL